jgi:hypothetical protein
MSSFAVETLLTLQMATDSEADIVTQMLVLEHIRALLSGRQFLIPTFSATAP